MSLAARSTSERCKSNPLTASFMPPVIMSETNDYFHILQQTPEGFHGTRDNFLLFPFRGHFYYVIIDTHKIIPAMFMQKLNIIKNNHPSNPQYLR